MEGVVSLKGTILSTRVPSQSHKPTSWKSQVTVRRSIPRISMHSHKPNATLRAQAQKLDSRDAVTTVSPISDSLEQALKIKDWEAAMLHEEIAASQGITIRRRPPTAPPLNYVGPFEFHVQNESNTPRNILEEIIWYKDIEVSQLKERSPLDALKKALDDAPPTRDFIGALKAAYQRTGLPGLIAEVKKASPSRGILREDFNPIEIAEAYEKGGAACLSVLTDEKYFKGGFENLEAIRNAGVKCPLLCKEFIVDAWQIYYARTKGADAVLLIAGVLSDLEIRYMTKTCKTLGLTALVEVHDEREMDRVLGIEGVELVGINSRDLETFKVDISNTRKLLDARRLEIIREKDIIVVGESGLFTPADINYVQEAGVKAVLVGESLVKQNDPAQGIANLFGRDISV
uniref:indole-3-glycerol-phosphate synthase n=1 Tax=Opuntia streptacantha TaxID=393608 RepID=A0A7C9CJY2_OPUST